MKKAGGYVNSEGRMAILHKDLVVSKIDSDRLLKAREEIAKLNPSDLVIKVNASEKLSNEEINKGIEDLKMKIFK